MMDFFSLTSRFMYRMHFTLNTRLAFAGQAIDFPNMGMCVEPYAVQKTLANQIPQTDTVAFVAAAELELKKKHIVCLLPNSVEHHSV